MSNSINFPCSQCGQCCKKVEQVAQLRFLDRGDGTCRFFNDANHLCSIYAMRPTICRVDRMYELYFKYEMSFESFIKLNAEVCNKIQDEANVPISFRLNIKIIS